MEEKRDYILATIIAVAIIVFTVILVVLLVNANNEEENSETTNPNTTNEETNNQNNTTTNPDNSTNKGLDSDHVVDGLVFSDIEYHYEDGYTYISFTITNSTNDDKQLGYYTIAAKDDSGVALFVFADNVGEAIAPNETVNRTLGAAGDHSAATIFEFNGEED